MKKLSVVFLVAGALLAAAGLVVMVAAIAGRAFELGLALDDLTFGAIACLAGFSLAVGGAVIQRRPIVAVKS